MAAESDAQEHLSAAQVAAYLDRVLPAVARERVAAHLVACSECRGEVRAVARALRPRRWTRWYVVGPAVAAAAASVVIAVGPSLRRSVPAEPTVRGAPAAPAEGIPRLPVVAPPADATVAPDAMTFVWHAAGRDAHYRLTLTEPDGRLAWTNETSDTTLQVPRSIALARGRTYYWYVDALLPDGRSASTGVRRLHTAR